MPHIWFQFDNTCHRRTKSQPKCLAAYWYRCRIEPVHKVSTVPVAEQGHLLDQRVGILRRKMRAICLSLLFFEIFQHIPQSRSLGAPQSSHEHTSLIMNKLQISRLFFMLSIVTFMVTTHAQENKYTKAVTYFGNAWPINYWNSNLHHTDSDFSEIKNDGFNAVIVVVPWGEFQPMVNPIKFNQTAYDRLENVCRSAKAHSLRFYMRVSYLWDMYPGVQQPHVERMESLFSHDDLMPAWKQYLQRLSTATKGCADGAFISWEDFWHMMPLAASPQAEKDSVLLSVQTGFDAWAEKHAGRGFFSRNADTKKRLGAYPFPARNSPDFRTVFEWFDSILIKRLLPVVAENIPNTSMEVRVDDDPIYDGEKLVEWYSHKQTYKIPSSSFVMTYWAPAMGAQNKGEIESAKKVQDRFAFMQEKISKETNNKIFIDQFLFTDNTPSASMNAAINPKEIGTFIQGMAKPLIEQTSGYALWGARDYYASIIFNAAFSLGKLGWNFSNRASIVKLDSDFFVNLPRGATISQSIPVAQNHFRSSSESVTLRFRVQGPGTVSATYAGITKIAKIKPGSQIVQMVFPQNNEDSILSFASQSGTIQLTDVYLFSFTQHFGVRDPQGRPLHHLADIRALNQAIDTNSIQASRLSADDQTILKASGVFKPEHDNNQWFAWAGPEVNARILAKVPAIAVRGYMKKSVFKRSGACTLDAFVNGSKVLSKTYTTDEPIDLRVPVTSPQIGTLVDLKLSSTCQINPKKQLTGNDDRTLGFILHEINAQTVEKRPK